MSGPHRPHRGDAVEAWITEFRDSFDREVDPNGWGALDWLLDDYRAYADAGLTLLPDAPVIFNERSNP